MEQSKLTLPFKQFKEEYLRELYNKSYLTQIEIETNTEILADQEDRLERMKSNAEICRNAIKEFEKDPSFDARQKRKAEEEKLREWEAKIKWQTEEIEGNDKKPGTRKRIEAFESNLENLGIYIKKVENNKQ